MKALFSKIGSGFKKAFSLKNLKKVDKVASKIRDVLEYAAPAVEVVAALTPTSADDMLVKMVKRYALPTPIPQDNKFDEATRQGILMVIAQKLVRENLSAAIMSVGENGLKIGDQIVKDQSEIPDSIINAATNTVYALMKDSMKVPE